MFCSSRLARKARGWGGMLVSGLLLRSRGSKPGNVLKGRCVPSATGLTALLS